MDIEELQRCEQQIQDDRKRLKIQPVEPQKLPAWASRRLIAVIGHRTITNIERLIPGPRLFDHWGRSPSDALVAEPYQRLGDLLLNEKVKRIADGLGVSYSIGSPWTSWWFPGKALRIEFFESPESVPLDVLRIKSKLAKRDGSSLFGITLPN